ncbi:MAG: prepilin-type N-terminal cleavage/methylation domain-containing protein [Gaiellaceae bacterium MAG52_C11]|nr:prepilin-type N-terminal cleavage/methylation domain-containing protein [Candidatus Gaiellasilicea maunaloa]
MRPLTTRLLRDDGFSLPEMMVAMALLSVLFAAFAVTMGTTLRIGGEVESNSDVQIAVRAAVDTLAADLRQAYSGSATVAPIESMSATAIQFFSPDRQLPFRLRRIGYQAAAGKLERRTATSTDTDGYPWTMNPAAITSAPWIEQADSLASTAVFTYLDASGATTTSTTAVRTVGIQVVVATQTSPTRQFTYQTSVKLRTPAP